MSLSLVLEMYDVGYIVKARDPGLRKAHQEVLPPFMTSLDPLPHTVFKQKETG